MGFSARKQTNNKQQTFTYYKVAVIGRWNTAGKEIFALLWLVRHE